MNQVEAEKIIESLRMGIPPDKEISLVTVGKYEEKIQEILKNRAPQSFLIEADYGYGKSHLLKLINEEGLKAGFVTSLVVLDAKANSRFNRMDQIFGQICRNIQVPNKNKRSIRYLFDELFRNSNSRFIHLLSNNGIWDFSNLLKSQAMFIALRAWFFSYQHCHRNFNNLDDLIEDWLINNHIYSKNRKKYLYDKLISSLKKWFLDSRYPWQFYRDNIFNFQAEQYKQSWDAISDLNTLAKATGYKGLIILFDEFEDVIYNLKNIRWQEAAFRNLIWFFSLEKLKNISFFAVTSSFTYKCKKLLQEKERWDFSYSTFNELPKFEVKILSLDELIELSDKIITIHEIAYGWKTDSYDREHVHSVCKESASLPKEIRVRRTIEDVVKALDECLEEKN